MKKNVIALLVAIVILGGLTGTYFIMQNTEATNEPEPTPEPTDTPYYYLTEHTKDDLLSFTLGNGDEKMSFGQREKDDGSFEWFIEEYPDANLHTYTVNSLVTSAYSLSTDMKITDEPGKLSDFGLDPPAKVFTSVFADGTESAVYIGNKTPAGDYYYAMSEDDPALYAIYKYTGDRLYYGISDLINIQLPTINSEGLIYAYIREAGKPEIELDFAGSEDEKQMYIAQYGAVLLTMFKPYEGREVYVSNFDMHVMQGMGALGVNELIEYEAQDLSVYGLDEPRLEIRLADVNNELHIFVGNETEDGGYNYCRLADSSHVFTVKKSSFDTFYNINVFGFIERFVALTYINIVDNIEIRSSFAPDYDITLNHIDDEDAEEDIAPEVNGQEVQAGAFRTFYSNLIGLAYDTEIPLYEPEDEPALTIIYYVNDGQQPVVTRYYEYNKDFYAVQKADYDIQFVVNKQSVNTMFSSMLSLLDGELDR